MACQDGDESKFNLAETSELLLPVNIPPALVQHWKRPKNLLGAPVEKLYSKTVQNGKALETAKNLLGAPVGKLNEKLEKLYHHGTSKTR
jgi:hypothetical protein